jgi:tetratricopeptide (TPR) repeat protein
MSLRYLFIFTSQLLLFVSCKQSNEYLLKKAGQLYEKKKYNEVIAICNDVIAEKNNLQLSYYYRGLAFAGLKQYKKAIHSLDIVMNLQSRDGLIFVWNKEGIVADEVARTQVPLHDALYQRALVKFQMDSLKSSWADFQSCIRSDYGQKSNCLLWQGEIYIRIGKKDKACFSFQKAKEFALNLYDSTGADNMFNEYCKLNN